MYADLHGLNHDDFQAEIPAGEAWFEESCYVVRTVLGRSAALQGHQAELKAPGNRSAPSTEQVELLKR